MAERDRQPSSLAYAMRALGRAAFPPTIEAAGKTYQLHQEIKHDFFAATAFYVEPATGEMAVFKAGRCTAFYGFPLTWIGRWLRNREVRFYRALADLPNVPAVLATLEPAAFLHAYVKGAPLSKQRAVPDGFFAQLQALMQELHRRGIAYVDTNKPENILQGEDGRPHLIDFQISLDLKTPLGNNTFTRFVLRHFQREDLYHILKHKRRHRPDELTEEEKARVEHKSFLIRIHRAVTKPYLLVRRRLFKKLRDAGHLLPEGSK